MQLLR